MNNLMFNNFSKRRFSLRYFGTILRAMSQCPRIVTTKTLWYFASNKPLEHYLQKHCIRDLILTVRLKELTFHVLDTRK